MNGIIALLSQLLVYGWMWWAVFIATALISASLMDIGGMIAGHIAIAAIVSHLDFNWILAEMARPGWNGLPDADAVFDIGVIVRVLLINSILLPVSRLGLIFRRRARTAQINRAVQKKHLVFLTLVFALYCAADFAMDAGVFAGTVIPAGDSECGPVIQRTRAPVPIEEARQNAETFVQIRFRDALAAQTQASRCIAAQQLLAEAKASRHHDAVTYVLLLKARDLAIGAADFDTAADAIGNLSRIYEVAGGPPMKLAALKSIRDESASHLLNGEVMARHALWIADEAIEEDDYSTATEAAAVGADFAAECKNPALVGGIQEYRLQLTQRVLDHNAFKDAEDVLTQNPNDADANLTAGRFFCFEKGEWEQGLPMLLRGSDPALRKLVAREYLQRSDWRARVSAGDAWWEYARTQTGLIRQAARAHACDVYHATFRVAEEESPEELVAKRIAVARAAEVRRDAMRTRARERAQDVADQRIVFICDASGSMINRLASAKVELFAEINTLPPASTFSILIFQDERVKEFAGNFLAASAENKLRATQFIEKIASIGTTNPLDALQRAFQEQPTVIHLLSDGDFPDNDAVLRRIRHLNRSGFVMIDTICFADASDVDDSNARIMKEIAAENDGTFKEIAD